MGSTAGEGTGHGQGRVIVIGSLNEDLVATAARLPAAGETVIGAAFAQHHGGKGGNQAVAAARLGARVCFVGAVGDDPFGQAAMGALIAEGIDASQLEIVSGAATGVALILVDAAGENSIAVAGGANEALSAWRVGTAMRALAPAPGDVVLVGHEIPTAAAAAALALGRSAGAFTILNPAPAAGLDAATVALADLVTPNEGEMAILEAAGIRFRSVLVSLGAAGARLVTATGSTIIDAPPVRAVDAVGAGDTLNGALAAFLAAGSALPDAARRAVAAASLAVTQPGAREGMPTLDELAASELPRR